MKKIDRIGEKRINKRGEMMEVVGYRKYSDIDVQFEDGTQIRNRNYKSFVDGFIKNPNAPSVFGIGFIGIGKYKASINYKTTPIYDTWSRMIERCYNEKHTTYANCLVCNEWHNFQNFAKWYEENKWNEDCMVLDKDILSKGNRMYSPDACIFVDQRLNNLFTKCSKVRGDCPVGVHKYRNKFTAFIKRGRSEPEYLGFFTTPEQAFQAYKQAKEKYIKQVADEYKLKYPNFPQKLYNAMYNYKVEIDD